ncbi:MAG: hypothetical protein Kow0062_21350 [Acidobacteriota bacterium]
MLAVALASGARCVGGAGTDALGSAADASPAIVRGTFERHLLLTGSLEAVRAIEIKAPQTPVFQMRIQFMAEEGTEVRPGDPLLDFDNSFFADQVEDLENRILDAESQIVSRRAQLRSDLKQLEIELAEREFEYERAKLYAAVDPEVVSRRDYDERQFEFEKARRELDEVKRRIALTREKGRADLEVLEIERDKIRGDLEKARRSLELLSIRAPAAGLVVYKRRPRSTVKFQEGDSCWPGTTVMRLPDLSEMRVVFDVNEVDVPALRVGQQVAVTLDAFPGRTIAGRIEEIPSMAVRRSEASEIRIFRVAASLAESWPGRMRPGMSALGRVVVERRESALLARRDRLRRGPDGTTVVVLDGRRTVPVEVLDRNERFALLAERPELAALAGAPRQGGAS